MWVSFSNAFKMTRTYNLTAKDIAVCSAIVLVSVLLLFTVDTSISTERICLQYLDAIIRTGDEVTALTEASLDTNIAHYDATETALESQFNSLFRDIVNNSTNSSLLLYQCDGNCTNNGLYESGVVSAFLFSALANRKLVIFSQSTCSPFEFYSTKIVDWRTSWLKFSKMDVKEVWYREALQGKQAIKLDHKLQDIDFKNELKDDVVVLSGNFDWLSTVRRHLESDVKTSWMWTLKSSDVLRLVNFGLFESMSKSIKELVTRQILEQVQTKKLVCFAGGVNSNSISAVVSRLESMFGSRIDRNKYYGNVFTGCNNTIAKHVVQINLTSLDEFQTCPKTLQDLVDAYVFSRCNVLITTNNPVGIHAAHMRINSAGLFCCSGSGIIYPCIRDLITFSFRDTSRIPRYRMLFSIRAWDKILAQDHGVFIKGTFAWVNPFTNRRRRRRSSRRSLKLLLTA